MTVRGLAHGAFRGCVCASRLPRLLNEILAKGEEQCRQKGASALGVWTFTGDTERTSRVIERGYTLLQETGVHRLHKMTQAPCVPHLPLGYSITSLVLQP